MKQTFIIRIDELQPSQLYINKSKLNRLQNWYSKMNHSEADPLPVIKLDNHIVLTDGHTRLYQALLHNLNEIYVYWDEDELDLEAYQMYFNWCIDENIQNVHHLRGRILNDEQYEEQWMKRCREQQQHLEEKRQLGGEQCTSLQK